MSRSTTQQIFSTQERRDPTVTDDESLGYLLGATWLNLLTGFNFYCRNPRTGAAWWFSPDTIIPTPVVPIVPVTPSPVNPPGGSPWLTNWDDNLYMRVTTTAAETVGKMVYVSGGFTSASTAVSVADPSDSAKMPAIGVVVSKSSSTTGIVQKTGRVRGVFIGLTPQKTYLVGLGGGITYNATTPQLIQNVGVAIDTSTLQLTPQLNMTRRL